jgi:glycosyltransferase involved in cell wall biosynthesis
MIECHVLVWNEAETIHLTIKHYQAFCERIVLWDNYSDDGTPEIAKAMGCTVKTFGKKGELSDRAYLEVKNEGWKKTHNGPDRRDWVIVVDADEILLPIFDAWRSLTKAHTIYKTKGWNVFHENVPRENWLEITNGHEENNYSKSVIFDPKRIADINYRIGAHTCSPKGQVVWSEETLWLFHYRNVGGPERLVKRHALYRERLSEENKVRGFGIHYTWEDEIRIKEWEEKYEKSKPFSLVGSTSL